MDNTIATKNQSLKCGFAIKALSIISLIFSVFACSEAFFCYSFIDDRWVISAGNPFYSPGMIVLRLLLILAPIILLMLYIFKFHGKLKATVLVPIIFGFNTIRFLFVYGYYGRYLLLELVILVCVMLAVISALKGFSKKVFLIISMVICLLGDTLSLISAFVNMNHYIEESMYLYIFMGPLSVIGEIMFHTALLIFGLKNRIPAIISPRKKVKTKAGKMNPEQALKLLKKELEQGLITEEEYQAKRAEIISKL